MVRVRFLVMTLSLFAIPALASQRQDLPSVRLEFRLAEDALGNGLIESKVQHTGEKIYLHKEAVITNEDIIEAQMERFTKRKEVIEAVRALGINVDPDIDQESFQVRIRFTKSAGERMAKVTEQNRWKILAVLVDGKVIAAPQISAKISNEAIIIGGGGLGFTKQEAERLVSALNKK